MEGTKPRRQSSAGDDQNESIALHVVRYINIPRIVYEEWRTNKTKAFGTVHSAVRINGSQ